MCFFLYCFLCCISCKRSKVCSILMTFILSNRMKLMWQEISFLLCLSAKLLYISIHRTRRCSLPLNCQRPFFYSWYLTWYACMLNCFKSSSQKDGYLEWEYFHNIWTDHIRYWDWSLLSLVLVIISYNLSSGVSTLPSIWGMNTDAGMVALIIFSLVCS